MKKTTLFLSGRILSAVLLSMGHLASADAVVATKEVPYKLIEGKQYEICNALLPFINTMPHGTLREKPELLGKVKDFRLPDWKQVNDKKYIDLYLNESRSPSEFSKEKYPENFAKVSDAVDKEEMRFYVAKIDIDNTGSQRPVLRQDIIENGKIHGLLYRFSYFSFDEKTMEPSKQYPDLIDGSAVYYKGRTFRFVEWLDVLDYVNFWSVGVAEPYYDAGRPKIKSPPEKSICKFSAR